MSNTVTFRNTSGKALHKLSEKEIRAMVMKQADRMLNTIPKDIRVGDVSAVQLESSTKQAAVDGVWAQWTRACCDKRRLIDGFTNPVNPELAITKPEMGRALHQDHFDANLSIRQITESASLKKIKSRGR